MRYSALITLILTVFSAMGQPVLRSPLTTNRFTTNITGQVDAKGISISNFNTLSTTGRVDIFTTLTNASNYKRVSIYNNEPDVFIDLNGQGAATNGGDFYIRNMSGNHQMRFWTAGIERFRIDNTGVLYGDGGGMTNLIADNLTGTLPIGVLPVGVYTVSGISIGQWRITTNPANNDLVFTNTVTSVSPLTIGSNGIITMITPQLALRPIGTESNVFAIYRSNGLFLVQMGDCPNLPGSGQLTLGNNSLVGSGQGNVSLLGLNTSTYVNSPSANINFSVGLNVKSSLSSSLFNFSIPTTIQSSNGVAGIVTATNNVATLATNVLTFTAVSSLTNTLGYDGTASVSAGTSVVLQDSGGNTIDTIGTVATLHVLIPMRKNYRISGTGVSCVIY
jgi:hypothetical protein